MVHVMQKKKKFQHEIILLKKDKTIYVKEKMDKKLYLHLYIKTKDYNKLDIFQYGNPCLFFTSAKVTEDCLSTSLYSLLHI